MMDKETVLAQLEWVDQLNYNEIRCSGEWIECRRGEPDVICLDGHFSLEDLRAMIYWFENPNEFKDVDYQTQDFG